MESALRILYEDAHCLAVVKAAGLLTQGHADGEPTLEDAVRRHLAPCGSAAAYLGTVHRLDRPVSGVVLWAKTLKAARRLAEQFEARQVRKEYWALVTGTVSPPEGYWDDWIGPVDVDGVAHRVRPTEPQAKAAVTRYRRMASDGVPPGLTWVRLWPETGRTHQLRAQAAGRGCPIVGDAPYGSRIAWPRGIALHARWLSIRHPMLQRPIAFVAPTPEYWPDLIEAV